MNNLILPDNKKFAFTIFDDTDVATLENIRPIYSKLRQLSMFTTKSVWPSKYSGESSYAGSHTLQDKEYCEYIKQLAKQGFEISFHNATMESSDRAQTIESLQRFKDVLGKYPDSYASHALNRENIYWGENRFSNYLFRFLYRLLNGDVRYFGEKPESKYFWGDICKNYIKTIRTFTYAEINLLNITKQIFYIDKNKHFFNSCFITADADNVEEFNELISLKNQDILLAQNGICIVSTHFGKGFVEDGKLNKTTDMLLTKLSEKDGWFVPVSQLYDYYVRNNAVHKINRLTRFRLESMWFFHALKRMKLKRSYKKTELNYLDI